MPNPHKLAWVPSLTGQVSNKTAHPAHPVPNLFFKGWAAGTPVPIGFQANCPPCPTFFSIQWEKKDKGYKKEIKRRNNYQRFASKRVSRLGNSSETRTSACSQPAQPFS